MANFVQVMKDWKRMCLAMEKLHPNDSCAGCRLEGYGCPAIYEDNCHVDYSDVEKNVMEWAAEHPEPVYPTWFEWLEAQKVVVAAKSEGTEIIYDTVLPTLNMFAPIPADIAEKLGIEPKEG